jgi:hypothetical protein
MGVREGTEAAGAGEAPCPCRCCVRDWLLALWFDAFNEALFDNELPVVPLRFARILWQAEGFYHHRDRLIEVADELVQENDQQAALLHEMVHLWQSCNGHSINHGKSFKDWRARVLAGTGLCI